MNDKLQFMGKLMVIILLVCCAQNGAFAQLAFQDNSGKENQDIPKRSLKSVLLDFQNQHGVSISFKDKDVEGKTVAAEIQYYSNEEEALTNLLKPLGLKYEKIKEGVYVISKKDDSPAKKKGSKKTGTNKWGKALSTMFQDVTINGKVTSEEDGEALPGVNVVIKGTTKGTVTDISGNYTLDAPEDGVLVFSFIGYKTKEVPVNSRSVIDVALVTDIQSLDEVVVVGYGAQKEVNVIGSIATISNEDIQAIPVPNASNALAGRLPGLIVQQNSGEPGHNAANLLIRGRATLGNNSPLVVINGIQGRDLNSINPNDIKSISVLKDAAAAIYGANAANGVILITTKSGKKNTAPMFTYDIYRGFKTPTMLPEMTDAATYAKMIRETQLYRGIAEENMAYSQEDIKNLSLGSIHGRTPIQIGMTWHCQITHQPGAIIFPLTEERPM